MCEENFILKENTPNSQEGQNVDKFESNYNQNLYHHFVYGEGEKTTKIEDEEASDHTFKVGGKSISRHKPENSSNPPKNSFSNKSGLLEANCYNNKSSSVELNQPKSDDMEDSDKLQFIDADLSIEKSSVDKQNERNQLFFDSLENEIMMLENEDTQKVDNLLNS